jgi:ParB/Sulfiredoxin domain
LLDRGDLARLFWVTRENHPLGTNTMLVEAESRLKFHDVTKKFRLMSEREYQGLKADIEANGQLVPIWTYQGKIVDGRHRYRACLELGITPLTKEWDGVGSLIAFVDSMNHHRRHLTASELAMKAAGRASQGRGRPATKAPIGAITLDQAAAEENVSKKQVERSRQIKEKGVPGLAEAVARGEVRLTAAAEVAGLSAEEQAEVVAGGAKAIKAKAAEIRRDRQAQSVGGRGRENSRADQGRPSAIDAPGLPPVEAIHEVSKPGVLTARTGLANPATFGHPAADATVSVEEDLPAEMPDSTPMDGFEAAEESPGPDAEPAHRGSLEPRGATTSPMQRDREAGVEPGIQDRQEARAEPRERIPDERRPVAGALPAAAAAPTVVEDAAPIETEDQLMELILGPLKRLRRDRQDPATELGKFRSRWSGTQARRDHVARLQAAEHFSELGDCARCKGSGFVVPDGPCRACKATGLVLATDFGPPVVGGDPSPWDPGGRPSD